MTKKKTVEEIPIIGVDIPKCKEKTCSIRMQCAWYSKQQAISSGHLKKPKVKIDLDAHYNKLWLRVICLSGGTTVERKLKEYEIHNQ